MILVVRAMFAVFALFASVLTARGADPAIPQHLLGLRFPQTKIGDCSALLPGKVELRIPLTPAPVLEGGTEIRVEKDKITVQGMDQSGEVWTVRQPNAPGGCQAWKVDLDGNGIDDLLLVTFGRESDDGSTMLVALMMDAAGKPKVWRKRGRFETDDAGIVELVDLNRDRRAELIDVMQGGGQTYVFLYRAELDGLREVQGAIGGVVWPIKLPQVDRERPDDSRQDDAGTAATAGPGSAIVVTDVQFTEEWPIEALRKIAKKYKVLISVSGTCVGQMLYRKITVSVPTGTIRQVLNSISAQVPGVSWLDDPDGSIAVTIGPRRSALADVVVRRFHTADPVPWALEPSVMEIPEVHDWVQRNCSGPRLNEMIGSFDRELSRLHLKLDIQDQRLASVLNRLAVLSGSYFWAAIEYKGGSYDCIAGVDL